MLPGPDLIKKCSECSGLLREASLTSGNTFGATYWTDTKRDAPMLPEQSWLIKCPHCNASLWIDELEQIAEVDMYHRTDSEEQYEQAKQYRELGLSDYYIELEAGGLEKQKEQYLRFQAWQVGNDPRRGESEKPEMTDNEKKNLLALKEVLDVSDDNGRLLIAEIMRELGNFEAAMAYLEEPFEEGYIHPVSVIKGLNEKQNPWVGKL